MDDILPNDLLARIRARLGDDWRRTGEGDWQRTPVALRRKSEVTSPVGRMLESLLATHVFNSASEAPLKAIDPLSENAVQKVEKALGFTLPPALRQLYREVGDGGFGPFNGIRRLSNWAKDYAKLRAEMPAERGREWPEALLPIVYLNGKRLCVDRDSGAVVLWTKPPKKASEKKWLASFVPQSASLAEWLERWVDTPTWCEGGPDGGWAPPAAEVERREAVEREKAERHAAELEKSQRIVFGDHPPLDDLLLQRVRERALDPARRTYLSGAMAGSRPVDLDGLMSDFAANPHVDDAVKQQLGGLAQRAGLLSRLLNLGGLQVLGGGGPGSGFVMAQTGAGGTLGKSADERSFAKAEAALGFALPAPLRQLYAIADGGFGPGDEGFWPLDRVAKEYHASVAKMQGPNDEPWPAKLLPLYRMDPAVGCLDLESGAIVVHDVERMDHLGRGQWARSFVTEHAGLAALLEDWLGSRTYLRQSA